MGITWSEDRISEKLTASSIEYADCISPHKCRVSKLSDSEASVLKLWRMWSTSSLPLLPDPL